MKTLWDHLHLALMRIYNGPPRKNDQALCSKHLYLSAWYIQHGSVRLQQQETVVEVGEKHWVFPRMAPRYQQFAPGSMICSIAVEATWPDGRSLFDKGLPAAVAAFDNAIEVQRLLPIFQELLALSELPSSLDRHLALRAATSRWVQALHALFLSRGMTPDDRAFLSSDMAKIVETMNDRPLHHAYSGVELAKHLGFSKTHFERLCVRALGKSPKRFFDERRLEHAIAMLVVKSVKEVASEVGFAHASTFSAWFKKNMGISPRDLKEREGR